MSAEAQAYVEAWSPYSGDTYLIHLRMAMIANETHEYRLFVGDKKLADLCRCSVKTLQRARKCMIEDGYLERLRPATGRQVAEYRFLMPEIGGHSVRLSSAIGGHPVPNRWTSRESSPIYRIKDKRSEERPLIIFNGDPESDAARRHAESSPPPPGFAAGLRLGLGDA